MEIVGICLANDVAGKNTSNIGVCLLPKSQLEKLPVTALREVIQQDLAACPRNFVICTPQGWCISESQERELTVAQVLSDSQQVIIRVKHDGIKCGIKDYHGNVIGFVHINGSSKLNTLRQLLCNQILECDVSFCFLDGNNWPVSNWQESHMQVADIMIGSCVSTNLLSKVKPCLSSPPKEPPFKKLKCAKELSFSSGKDVGRQLSSGKIDDRSSAKEVLISYVRSEAAHEALKLKHELTSRGLSVYLDVHEIQTGVDWQDSLNFAVSSCEVFVPLVTMKYGETQWTNREVKLADVLGKYILPVSFLDDWPPRCLAIQFATTQFIPAVQSQLSSSKGMVSLMKDGWSAEEVQTVAQKIADRVKNLSPNNVPALLKRATVVKSCACVTEDNKMAITSHREGKPLIMICLHHSLQSYGQDLQAFLEEEGFEVWCTTELDKEHIEHIDALACSQGEITYSVLNRDNGLSGADLSSSHSNSIMRNIEIFQEKADDASIVLFILSEEFSKSRVCQQQVFYCEHRKRVVPILYEDFQMPQWMAMLVGSHGFEMRKDEDFVDILLRRVKSALYQPKLQTSPAVLPLSTRNRIGFIQTSPDSRNGIGLNQAYSSVLINNLASQAEQTVTMASVTECGEDQVDSKPSVVHGDSDTFTPDEALFQYSPKENSNSRPSLASMKTVIL